MTYYQHLLKTLIPSVFAFTVIGGLYSCGNSGSQQALNDCESRARDSRDSLRLYRALVDTSSLLSSTHTLTPISNGNSANNGYNIAVSQYMTGGVSRLDFYWVRRDGATITQRILADLRTETVEIFMHNSSTLGITVYDEAHHHYGTPPAWLEYQPTNNVDFKISLSYPGYNQMYIVGTEDDRPSVLEFKALGSIHYSLFARKRIRLSYDSASQTIRLSANSNTSVAVDSLGCAPSVTGVPFWGLNWLRTCQ